jgi:hypothetical protein
VGRNDNSIGCVEVEAECGVAWCGVVWCGVTVSCLIRPYHSITHNTHRIPVLDRHDGMIEWITCNSVF